MVEASLRPRPEFSTFLHSDTNASGDGLSYYDYQRLIRARKVALLQEKRAKTRVPGYKKLGEHVGHSRKVFQLTPRPSGSGQRSQIDNKQVAFTKVLEGNKHLFTRPEAQAQQSDVLTENESSTKYNLGNAEAKNRSHLKDGGNAQTERLPHLPRQQRLVKSATARDRHPTWPVADMGTQIERPKTVSSVRDTQVQASQLHLQPTEDSRKVNHSMSENMQIKGHSILRDPSFHQRAQTEGSQEVDLEGPDELVADRDALVNAFIWGTTTQRAYDEVGWADRLPPPISPPPTVIEQFPDPVAHKTTFRRYHSEPADWQGFGPEWDYVQARIGGFTRGPQNINFCSWNRKTQQLPGYCGYIPDSSVTDDPFIQFNPALLVRSLKPRHTNISRRPNIPGYAGHVHWNKTTPTNSSMPKPEPTTTARVHRSIPLEEDLSPLRRNGLFSKMITTVSPHNPFNKIEQ